MHYDIEFETGILYRLTKWLINGGLTGMEVSHAIFEYPRYGGSPFFCASDFKSTILRPRFKV